MSEYIPGLMSWAIGLGGLVFFVLMLALIAKSFYIKVEQGVALIKNGMKGKLTVSFTGAMIYPVINKMEKMRISLITMEVDRRGTDGLICRDNMRADITVAFYLRAHENTESVLKVAKAIGASRASDKEAVYELFNAKFSEALKSVGKQIDFVSLFEDRQQFRESIVKVIGDDLNGYSLEDVAIDYLEQTPKSSLDPNNILDAQGIRKITELTALQNIETNMYERDEELAIKKKDVETHEAMLELARQEADAEAKQEREIATVRAREEAERIRVQEEERQKSESAKIQTDQELSVQTENQQREIEVAEQNRLRAVVIEKERVSRAQELEVVSRVREVELQRIEAEKAVEIEKKEIANVIRERISVDKTVAIEEERIKEVREISEADRRKQIQVLDAEALAQELKVQEVTSAEAQEESAKHKAAEITVLAQANLEAAAKEADSNKKLAEGTQATAAAPGLAEAKVREAKADAMEKEGLANARVIASTGQSEAEVIAAKGDADAKARREIGFADAAAQEKVGLSEAVVIAAQGESEAIAKRGVGLAEADVVREKFKAEAEGLVDKFGAMDKMSDKARAHEEYRMGLETALQEALASMDAGKEIAKENAQVLSVALQKAKIDIVGGEEHFFDNFAKSLSIGKAIDGLAEKSGTIQAILGKVMEMTSGAQAPAEDAASEPAVSEPTASDK